MTIFLEGLSAFLKAAGIAAVLWVLYDGFMCPKKAVYVPVLVPLSGDADQLERLLRRLAGLPVTLLDHGLSDAGRRWAAAAARQFPNVAFTNITLEKWGDTHG